MIKILEWTKLDGEKKVGSDLFDMNRLNLSDMEDGDYFTGRPEVSGIEERVDFNDPEKKQYIIRFNIVDDDAKKYLNINVRLKNNENIQRNVHKQSSLFALVDSLSWILDEYWQVYDIIKEVNITNLRNFINSADTVTVHIIEREADFGSYNSFRILDIS